MTKKVLIYGGSGGIGSATARALRERGYGLHLVARNEDKLKAIADELDADYTAGDIGEEGLFSRVATEAGGQLAGLVYAVGTIHLRRFQQLTEAEYLTDFKINAVGAALAVQASLPALKENPDPSSIVLYSSVAALQGFSLHVSMGMAKGAVAGLTLSLAAELAPRVRVNAIAPSLTRTPSADRIIPNSQMSAAVARLHALPRLGKPEDIAALTAFLISSEADWITGQIISVDGGRSTLRPKG
ncbi:MAG: SDR family oxidoreductase [Chitinivibrionales bacterium]|nr:SDR family oxidoreductase [Chitinivibrionales bacterium]MBD3358903.1 SDR family oxidoreductase [Chitinivibrionales bacterium]